MIITILKIDSHHQIINNREYKPIYKFKIAYRDQFNLLIHVQYLNN